tara:strand:- start:2410 stop:2610 length:201 start_codon:yes stop_codon:yes gene_type:complete
MSTLNDLQTQTNLVAGLETESTSSGEEERVNFAMSIPRTLLNTCAATDAEARIFVDQWLKTIADAL